MAIALTYKISGIDRQDNVTAGSIHITDNLWARNNLSIKLVDNDFAFRPVVGNPVILYGVDGITKLFAGSIDEVEETYLPGAQPTRTFTLQCVDNNQIADRFLVIESFVDPAQTLSDVVDFLVTNYLAADDVTYSGTPVGPVIPETKLFNYRTMTQVFNELATLTNYVPNIDYDKVLTFVPRSANVFGTTLGPDNCLSATWVTSRGIGPYRNVQYVRAGTAMTDLRVEPLHGDSFRRTFNTTYPVERTPTITLNGSPVTVGIHGLDTAKEYYWTRGANQIVQDDSGTLLTSSDVLAVTYIGRFPVVVVSQNDTEIAARQAIEGGSGVYQSLHTDPNLNDLLASQNLAKALLDRNSFIPDHIKIVTDVAGLRAGQLVSCDFPMYDLVGSYLAHSVETVDVGGAFLRYRVNLLNWLDV